MGIYYHFLCEVYLPILTENLTVTIKMPPLGTKWYCSKNTQLTFKIRLALDLQSLSGILSLERSQMCHWKFWTPAFLASMSFLPAHGSTLISALWTFQAFETCRWNETPAVTSVDSLARRLPQGQWEDDLPSGKPLWFLCRVSFPTCQPCIQIVRGWELERLRFRYSLPPHGQFVK